MIQGGDFTKRNGQGGESIYSEAGAGNGTGTGKGQGQGQGKATFEDERLEGEGSELDREG